MFLDTVISGDVWSEVFSIKNSLKWSIPEVGQSTGPGANFWIAPFKSLGEFILKFDQPRVVSVIMLVNTHNGDWFNMGTKEFKVNIYLLFIIRYFIHLHWGADLKLGLRLKTYEVENCRDKTQFCKQNDA